MIRRSLLTISTLVALAFAGAAGVRSAEPTIGAAVQNVVYLSDGGELQVQNRGDLPSIFTFTDHDGWKVQPESIVLAPGETGKVTVSGVGSDGGFVEISVTGEMADPLDGARSVLAFTSRIYLERPFSLVPWLVGGLLGLLAVVALAWVLRRTRPWEFRLARR